MTDIYSWVLLIIVGIGGMAIGFFLCLLFQQITESRKFHRQHREYQRQQNLKNWQQTISSLRR